MSGLSAQANALFPLLMQIPGVSQQTAMAIAMTIGNCDDATTQNGPATFNGPLILGPEAQQGLAQNLIQGSGAVLQSTLNAGSSAMATLLDGSTVTVKDTVLSVGQSLASGTPIVVTSFDGGTTWLNCTITQPSTITAPAQLSGNLIQSGTASATLQPAGTTITVTDTIIPYHAPYLASSALITVASFDGGSTWYNATLPTLVAGTLSADLLPNSLALMSVTEGGSGNLGVYDFGLIPTGQKLASGTPVLAHFFNGLDKWVVIGALGQFSGGGGSGQPADVYTGTLAGDLVYGGTATLNLDTGGTVTVTDGTLSDGLQFASGARIEAVSISGTVTCITKLTTATGTLQTTLNAGSSARFCATGATLSGSGLLIYDNKLPGGTKLTSTTVVDVIFNDSDGKWYLSSSGTCPTT